MRAQKHVRLLLGSQARLAGSAEADCTEGTAPGRLAGSRGHGGRAVGGAGLGGAQLKGSLRRRRSLDTGIHSIDARAGAGALQRGGVGGECAKQGRVQSAGLSIRYDQPWPPQQACCALCGPCPFRPPPQRSFFNPPALEHPPAAG